MRILAIPVKSLGRAKSRLAPALSPQHHRVMTERISGQVVKLVELLAASDPQKLAAFRSEYEVLAADFFEDNAVRQTYLMTRATKV